MEEVWIAVDNFLRIFCDDFSLKESLSVHGKKCDVNVETLWDGLCKLISDLQVIVQEMKDVKRKIARALETGHMSEGKVEGCSKHYTAETKDAEGERILSKVKESDTDCTESKQEAYAYRKSSSGKVKDSETDYIETKLQDAEVDRSPSRELIEDGDTDLPKIATSDIVQIKASSQEIDRRISAFIEQKRQEVNDLNQKEFCLVPSTVTEIDQSCARVDSLFATRVGGKSHIKVSRVVNLHGPQTQLSISQPIVKVKKEPEDDQCHSSGIEERLQNIETHLKMDQMEEKADVYSRIKKLEDRILYLEGLSPEYFTGGIPQPSSKRQKISSQRPTLSSSQNLSSGQQISEIEDRIQFLRQSLRRKVFNRIT